MELKATLQDYTATEFQTLVERIWAVDLPRQDHDRLINHFDRVVDHPSGTDLLFYPDDQFGENSPDWVVHHIKGWHQQQGIVGFKPETAPVSRPFVSMSNLARNLTGVQEVAADVAESERVVTVAFGVLEQGIQQAHIQQGVPVTVSAQETSIRSLENAHHETQIAIRKFESLEMRARFARDNAQSSLAFAGKELAQWQSIVQQISATYDRYIVQRSGITQRHRALHDQAEALLIAAKQQLLRARALADVGVMQTARVITAPLMLADKRPDLLLSGDTSELLRPERVDLRTAIRSAVAELTWRKTAGESTDESCNAGVLQFEFSSRADTQVFGLSVLLSELFPTEGVDWSTLAARQGEIDLPYRMGATVVPAKPGTMFRGLREIKALVQIQVSATGSKTSATPVGVRAARYDRQTDTFVFTGDGNARITVQWPVRPNPETNMPASPASLPRLGFVHVSTVPAIEREVYTAADRLFDDYIVVFPSEFGLEPLYVMFGSEREYPV